MFIILLPRIVFNLEYHLSEIISDDESRKLVNELVNKIHSQEQIELYSKKFNEITDIEEIKEILHNQAKNFLRYFIEETTVEIDIDNIDKSLIKVLLDCVNVLLNMEPNTKGLEYAIIDARRDYRSNSWWLDNYNSYRSLTEMLLIDIEKITNNFIPAIIFQLSKSLEEIINNIQEYRTHGIINLVFVDSEFRLLKRNDNLNKAVAKLTLDKTSNTGKLFFNKYANLIARRTAQRIAHSIVKMGFELPDNTRTGMNFILEIQENDFY